MDWSKFDKGIFLVNVLAVIFDPKEGKILIGRREEDKHFEGLTWCFPGGRPEYFGDLDYYLKHEVRRKTNLDVSIDRILFAKTYPEKRQFLSIYYLCTISSQQSEKPGSSFIEIKWIKTNEIQKYFTTSIHPGLLDMIKSLVKGRDETSQSERRPEKKQVIKAKSKAHDVRPKQKQKIAKKLKRKKSK